MRLRFGLQQCLPSNFSPRPLYTCTPTLKVSFNQRGTLAFAACLSNLTSKGLGHLSLSLSLSTSFPPARMHMRSHYSSARASIAPPKRVASEVKHSFARSWTIRDISADKKEKKQQRGQMFAQQTSFQVFPVPPVACRRQEISIFARNSDFFARKTKTGGQKKFPLVVKSLFLRLKLLKSTLGMVKIFIPEIESTCFWKKSNFSIFRNVEISYLPGPGRGWEQRETVGSMSAAGWARQQQGGYGLVGLVPRYRMVCFGSHLTQSERAGVDKLLPYKCRETICKRDYFCTTFSLTNGGRLKVFPI